MVEAEEELTSEPGETKERWGEMKERGKSAMRASEKTKTGAAADRWREGLGLGGAMHT